MAKHSQSHLVVKKTPSSAKKQKIKTSTTRELQEPYQKCDADNGAFINYVTRDRECGPGRGFFLMIVTLGEAVCYITSNSSVMSRSFLMRKRVCGTSARGGVCVCTMCVYECKLVRRVVCENEERTSAYGNAMPDTKLYSMKKTTHIPFRAIW